jgi:hypothetical protein
MHRRYAATAALLVALSGCAGNGDGDDRKPEADPTAGDTSSGTPSEQPTGSQQTGVVEPERALLDWKPVAGSLDDRVLDAGDWTITVPESGSEVVVSGARDTTVPAGRGRVVEEVLVSDTHVAVVVARDDHEERPPTITTVDLETGSTYRMADPAPAPGAVAVGRDALHYATYDDAGRYCLATTPIAGPGEVTWCAEERHGWSNVLESSGGTTLMTFDDQRPSCRTLVSFPEGVKPVPVPGVEECKGWAAGLTADGAVWSVIPRENRIESAHFYARGEASGPGGADGTAYDLGPGTSGSLFSCGDSLFFTRDARGGAPAQLLRWTDDGTLEVAYESPGTGEGFVSAQCAGDAIVTVTAYGEGGDERVSATVPG